MQGDTCIDGALSRLMLSDHVIKCINTIIEMAPWTIWSHVYFTITCIYK